jgi:tRNA (cytidine/uridine-2'-O-)-methyltransferase
MIAGHPHICLYKPEIPQNAGNIGRLAAATQCRMHLIRPFGFSASDKNLRRAGLDYWPFLDLEIHDDLETVLSGFSGRFAFLSTKGVADYTQIPIETELLIFGQETKGLPPELYAKYPESFYKIPMFHQGVRSLNLSNSVSLVLYNHLLKRRSKFGIEVTI